MGELSSTTCLDCGTQFQVFDGGGFRFRVLRCEKCGQSTTVTDADLSRRGVLGVLRLRSRKVWGANIGDVERVAGHCACGGAFRIDAPPRCPNCLSISLQRRPTPDLLVD